MKTLFLLAGLALGLVGTTSAAVYYNGIGGIILDGSDNPLRQTIVSTDVGPISAVSLVFNISGGYNGDLYGYLTYNDGSNEKTQIILNRLGGGNAAASGSGFGTAAAAPTDYASLQAAGVKLVDGGAGGNIHNVTPGAGNPVVAGNYTPDSGVNFNSTFGGMGGSGTWTLLLFDKSAGDTSTLVGWGLDVTAVPEPTTWALGIFSALAGIGRLVRWWYRSGRMV